MKDNKSPTLRLRDLFANQAALRGSTGLYPSMEVDELDSIVKLTRSVFGNIGVVEWGPEEPGILYAGFYKDPDTVPSHRRRRKLVFRFTKYRELLEQVQCFRRMTNAEQRSVWGSDSPS